MLPNLFPIIEFTNFLIKKYNLELKRQDARKIKIAQVFDDKKDGVNIKILWHNFKKAWKSLEFNELINFDSKQNTFKKDYDETSTLNNFLVDDKENEGGMCMAAAMQELARIQ